MPLVTAVIVLMFGSLTLFFHDATLIKIKPTVLYLLFAAALFAGLALNRPILNRGDRRASGVIGRSRPNAFARLLISKY